MRFGKALVVCDYCGLFLQSDQFSICRDTLSKCPGGHSILHWRLKLNSKILAGKYKKKNLTEVSSFSTGELSKCYVKKCRDSINRIVTLAKIQSAREASSNFNEKLPNILLTCLCLCLRILWLLIWPSSNMQGKCITS